MSKLYFRYGTMGCGKSIDLIKVAYNYEERGKKVLLITAGIDDRYEVGKITTRIGLKRSCKVFFQDTNIYNMCKTLDYLPDCILIDEAQFLNKKQVYQLSNLVDYDNIPVICYGLRSDFKNELFEGSKELLSICDKIEEIKTICDCGSKASVNMRIIDNKVASTGDQIVIGDSQYKSVCRKCYKERISEDGKNN